jgi:hypothetical protein
MGAEGFANVSQAGKRTAKRARVLLAAKLRTHNGEVDAKLRDLSQKGALVECSQAFPVDAEVIFSRGTTVVPARIAWCASGRIGLEFLRPIDENGVLVQLGRNKTATPAQRCRRPRVLGTDMTEQEKNLARVWGVQVGISVTGK